MPERGRTTSRIRLTYKEGCGELWVEKQFRTKFSYIAIGFHVPAERLLQVYVDAGRAEEALQALNREPWVAEVALANSKWRRLPPARQPLHEWAPEKPSDMERPFGKLHHPKGGCRGRR